MTGQDDKTGPPPHQCRTLFSSSSHSVYDPSIKSSNLGTYRERSGGKERTNDILAIYPFFVNQDVSIILL